MLILKSVELITNVACTRVSCRFKGTLISSGTCTLISFITFNLHHTTPIHLYPVDLRDLYPVDLRDLYHVDLRVHWYHLVRAFDVLHVWITYHHPRIWIICVTHMDYKSSCAYMHYVCYENEDEDEEIILITYIIHMPIICRWEWGYPPHLHVIHIRIVCVMGMIFSSSSSSSYNPYMGLYVWWIICVMRMTSSYSFSSSYNPHHTYTPHHAYKPYMDYMKMRVRMRISFPSHT